MYTQLKIYHHQADDLILSLSVDGIEGDNRVFLIKIKILIFFYRCKIGAILAEPGGDLDPETGVIPSFNELYKQNEDVVGFIKEPSLPECP